MVSDDGVTISDLVIKWDGVGARDDWGEPAYKCNRCGRPHHDQGVGPAIFVVGTWRGVCEACAAQVDPDLVARLWHIRAELDRGEEGPEVATWIATLEHDERGGHIEVNEIRRWLAHQRGEATE
jgi:hypothetical protein